MTSIVIDTFLKLAARFSGAIVGLATSFVMLQTHGASSAAIVRALPLPPGFTVSPESDRKRMTIASDGTVYGVANRIDDEMETRVFGWRGSALPEIFRPIPEADDNILGLGPKADAVVAGGSSAYVTIYRTRDGSHLTVHYGVSRWSGNATREWTLPDCVSLGYESTLVFAADAGRVALTIDPSSTSTGIDLANDRSVLQNLPEGVVIAGNRCTSLGTVILTALRGPSVAGYLGYLDGKRAPMVVNLMVQRMVATRWLHGREDDLGFGVPFATTSSGIVAGASALPGHASESVTGNFFGPAGTYRFATPHAIVWGINRERTRLFHDDVRSVAYDIDDTGTVVGMLERTNGRHYAFRRFHGKIEILDYLPHPPGWRFESAYAIAQDGSIAGIGTYRGVATAFLWRG
jgi:hypothetical protein